MMSLSVCLAVLQACWCFQATDSRVVLTEDFSGGLERWGLPRQSGELAIQPGPVVVPLYDVSDATIEYRAKVRGEGLIELAFRYDPDTDDYYLFRIDTRKAGGDPPGFLKRNHGEPPWVLVGQRTGKIPAGDTWLNVRVELVGKTFRGYLNNEHVATYEDSDFRVGGLAFRRQVSEAWIDDLKVIVPAGSSCKTADPVMPRPPKPPAPFTEGTWSAHWIWSPGTDEELVRVFRKSFDVPDAVHEATLAVTCDNAYELYVNGSLAGKDSDWYSLDTYDVRALLRTGRNELAVLCRNDGPGSAGLLLELGAVTRSGRHVHVVSDEGWQVSKTAPSGWSEMGFDDRLWAKAISVGKYPAPPWSNQARFRLPYLGSRQPIELVGMSAPKAIRMGQPFTVDIAWRPSQRLTGAYPIVLTARQGDQRPIELAVVEPRTPPSEWVVGQEHTETLSVQLWPDAGYFFSPGPIELGAELRGTFHSNRRDDRLVVSRLEASPRAENAAYPRPVAKVAGREGRFVDATGQEHVWSVSSDGRMMIDGRAHLPLDEEGVYWCEAPESADALAAIDWKARVKRISDRGGPSGADFVRVWLVDHIDATKTDHEFSEDGPARLGGKSRVLALGDRSYRITSNRPKLSYFAYTATCRHPRNPHLMMFQSVNDIERYTTLRIQPPWDNVGGGVYTGREFPCDGKPFEQGFIFYPRETDVRFTVSRWPVEKDRRPESGGAVSHVWLFELVDSMAARSVRTARPSGAQRRLGMYLTHPLYIYQLYGYRGETPEERRASVRSFIDYLKFCGINLLEFNAVDGGDTTGTAFYDSAIWPKATGNLLAELLPLCQENDIALVPIITSLSVPEGKFGFTKDSFQIDRFGKPTIFFDSRPPLPDPLRPEVQDLLLKNLREILDLCGKSPAVPAIGFRVNGKIGLCYGGSDEGRSDQYTGYSPWDIAEFKKDTGIDVPAMSPTPYEWIRANCWEKWLRWRCERTRQFWLRCRDLVRGTRDDLVLYASCDMPSETPAWNIYWPAGSTPLECWRFHGVDPRLFAREPGILLHRGMMIAADRYFSNSGQYARNVEAMKRFHYAPGVTELYNGAEGNACELYINYWEEFGVMPTGEFKTEFWGAATMVPLGRHYYEPIAFSVARTNCHTLNVFSWERGSFGHEHDLRGFARAFRALPKCEGEPAEAWIAGDAQGLWVRRFDDRLAILNTTGQPRTVVVQYAHMIPPGKDLIEFGRCEVVSAKADGARSQVRVELPLTAYELRVLGWE